MQELIIYTVFAYVVFKLLTGRVGRSLLGLIGLTRRSVKEKGGRATAHDFVDGLFTGAERARSDTRSARERVDVWRDERARDFDLDEVEERLTLFFGKQDIVLEVGARGGFDIVLVEGAFGDERKLTRKQFERFLASADRRGHLSRAQGRAIRSFVQKYRV